MSGILIFVGTPATKISAAPPRLWLRRYFEARPPLVTGSVIGTNCEDELVAGGFLDSRRCRFEPEHEDLCEYGRVLCPVRSIIAVKRRGRHGSLLLRVRC